MASASASDARNLVQNLFEEGDDGATTFQEALLYTEALKLSQLQKPLVTKKAAGAIGVGQLPLKPLGGFALKHVVDVVLHVEALDLVSIGELLQNNDYKSLPSPVSLASEPPCAYTMQIAAIPEGSQDNAHTLVKHIIYAEKLKAAVARAHLRGEGHRLDYQGNFRNGSKAFQHLFEQLGGFQVRYFYLSATGPKAPKSTSDINKGFDFIFEHAPRVNFKLQMTRWIEIQINSEDSPIFGWNPSLVEKSCRTLASTNSLVTVTEHLPLTLKDIRGCWLDFCFYDVLKCLHHDTLLLLGEANMGKTPVAMILAMALSRYWIAKDAKQDLSPGFRTASDLDFFRGEPGSKYVPDLFEDGDMNAQDRGNSGEGAYGRSGVGGGAAGAKGARPSNSDVAFKV